MTLNQNLSQTDLDCHTVYCSVEVSRSSWIIGVYCPETDTAIGTHKLESADTGALLALVRKKQARVGPEDQVLLCYEAGYEGFWLARYLERYAPDIDVVVLDPASLQIDRRAKKVKTDRMDTLRMIRAVKA